MRIGTVVLWVACLVSSAGAAAQVDGVAPQGRMAKVPALPQFAPSEEVHLLPTTMPENSTSSDEKDGSWIARGYDLKSLIAMVYEVDPARVEFADPAVAKKRYDLALVLPQEEDEDAMNLRVRNALPKRLGVSIVPEKRTMDVYVVSAPHGAGPAMRESDGMGGSISNSGPNIVTRSENGAAPTMEDMDREIAKRKAAAGIFLGSIAVEGGTVEEFCRELERGLDRPVVDESHLTKFYDFTVDGGDLDREGFFRLLQDRLGLTVTRARREVTMLVVR